MHKAKILFFLRPQRYVTDGEVKWGCSQRLIDSHADLIKEKAIQLEADMDGL